MKKILLLLATLYVAISTCSAVDIPAGTIYYDNSITQFSTVKFVYGFENTRNGSTVVTMTKGENDIWSYKINSKISSVSRYFFSNTSLDGTISKKISTLKDEIANDRGEKRTASAQEAITSGYIYVPENNSNGNWYQGTWMKMSDYEEQEDASNLPTANCNPHSATVPVVYLKTDNGQEITDKENYVTGTLYIDALNNEGYSSVGTEASPIVTELKGRGNYTWTGFDKKPYRIKMKSKEALLNLTKDKSFNLLAHADDSQGFLRNTTGFAVSRHFELAYTPSHEPVELFLNGKYRGLYFLTEHIKVSSNRVNITEQDDNETDSEAITGGWLLEIDNYEEDPHITIYKPEGDAMWFTYKSPEELSAKQEAYITNFLNLANNAIYEEDKSSTEWEKYIDMDALVNYYLTYEIVANREGFHGSCYLHKDRGADTKLKFGPVWDFGSALMNMDDTYIYEDYAWGVKWIDEIAKFPRFQQAVRERWLEKRGTLMPYLRQEVDKFIDKIASAAQCDCQKWPSYGNKNVLNEKETVYELLEKRLSWLDSNFGTVGLTEEEAVELSVFPNPTTDKISVNSNEEILSISVYNLAGNKLLDLDVNKTEWSLGLDAGTYILTVETAKNTISRKIIVK